MVARVLVLMLKAMVLVPGEALALLIAQRKVPAVSLSPVEVTTKVAEKPGRASKRRQAHRQIMRFMGVSGLGWFPSAHARLFGRTLSERSIPKSGDISV